MATREQVDAKAIGVVVLTNQQRAARPLVLTDVYREHVAFIARALSRLGVADAQLDDLVHDTFLIVHRKLSSFDGRAPLKSWLYGIARGVAANHRRSRDRSFRRQQIAVVDGVDDPRSTDPLQNAERDEAARLVEAFLDTLSPANREVFVLSEVEGWSGPEIAKALRMKVNTVYWRLRESRQAFEQIAEQHRQEAGR